MKDSDLEEKRKKFEKSLELPKYVRLICDFVEDLKKNPNLDVKEWSKQWDERSGKNGK